jgi:membrane fusion protein (multidrug efflux system)
MARPTGTAFAAILACLLAAGAGSAVLAQGGTRPPTPVEAREVKVESLLETVHAVGTLRADQSIIVRPEIAGVVTKIHFQDSSPVQQGQLLFSLDDTLYRAELQQADASLQLSTANYERAKELFEKRVGTARARDEAVANLAVDRAAAVLSRARLEKTRIAAAFDGIAGISRVDIGAYVQAGQDLVSLDDIDPVKIDVEVPERYLRFLTPGQGVRVEVDALPSRTFEGELTVISPRVDPDGRSLSLRIAVPNPDGILKPGLFVRANVIVERQENAILVPEQAIMPRGDKLFVFKVVEDKAKLTEVAVGLRAYGRAEIVRGLEPGDVVITAGQLKIGDGSPVKVVPPDGRESGG